MGLLCGWLLLAFACSLAHGQAPKLSVGQALQPLTNEAAFQVSNNPLDALRSNFNDDVLRKIARGAQEFGLDLFTRISEELEKSNKDFMISPFSVWSLLILLYEGAAGQTLEQLRQVLRVNVPDDDLRAVYRVWSSYLK